jgi:hypothetical protein
MRLSLPPRIVLLGMMTRMPVAGNVWLVAQYLEGFRRLGCDVYYVEAHGITPTKLMSSPEDDGSAQAARWLGAMMERFGFADRWAYHALHDDGRCYGIAEARLRELYRTADIIINLHGGTVPLPEHSETGRLLYLETDPVELEIELHDGDEKAIEFLAPHRSFATWGLNYGADDCRVPLPEDLRYRHSPPPVILDFWEEPGRAPGERFTTIGNWRQPGRVVLDGETYFWSKHLEFRKFIKLPKHTSQRFELALSSSSMREGDREKIERYGWIIRDALEVSIDPDIYRDYILGSRGEFTVAKDQNVRLRSGWFSERSAQYLAAGRPVITQDTGFGSYLPTGEGLFAFNTMEEILDAVERINDEYGRHSAAARELARTHLNYDVVLPKLLVETWQPANDDEVRRYLASKIPS